MATSVNGLLSAEEAAAELGISAQMVRKYAREGRIASEVVGVRTYVFARKAINDFKKVPRKVGNPAFQK